MHGIAETRCMGRNVRMHASASKSHICSSAPPALVHHIAPAVRAITFKRKPILTSSIVSFLAAIGYPRRFCIVIRFSQ